MSAPIDVPATVAAAAAAVRAAAGAEAPVAAIILGSGLGSFASRVADAVRVPYAAIPGFPVPSVHGHAGEVLVGGIAGRRVVCFAGRFHMYEGHGPEIAALPARVAHALGAGVLFASNAAGGVRRTFRPGDLMVIADHLNLMFRNPLTGPLVPGDVRFPDMSDPYDPALRRLLHEAARAGGVPLQEGVYCGLTGPTYETPAEVRMLERLGADAVGMSTVPEVIAARAMGMRCAGVSVITNPAAGLSLTPLAHDEVVEVGRQVAPRFEALVEGFVARL
ncbi:MAG: purine-nucleoside phosphorylase [Gemmatimonadaceae bacterium]|jgi:purine-nucleoside phosphorylase|nr:purine-nucleoside phosphorylase [Gemmatimonadaceae bacterium]